VTCGQQAAGKIWAKGSRALKTLVPAAKNGVIALSSLPQTSNNIIQKGLAFVCEWSGSVTVLGTKRASGSCPAGCMAEAGLRWWRRTTPHHATEDPDVTTHRYTERHSVLGFAAQ
jgi:hypothetical protein